MVFTITSLSASSGYDWEYAEVGKLDSVKIVQNICGQEFYWPKSNETSKTIFTLLTVCL